MGSTRSGLFWGPIGVTLVLAIVFAVPLWSDGGDKKTAKETSEESREELPDEVPGLGPPERAPEGSIEVKLELDRPPKLGEVAHVTFTVSASWDFRRVEVAFRLARETDVDRDAGIDCITAPEEFKKKETPGSNRYSFLCPLNKGETRVFEFEITVTNEGPKLISAGVREYAPLFLGAFARDDLYLDVGKDGTKLSKTRFPPPPEFWLTPLIRSGGPRYYGVETMKKHMDLFLKEESGLTKEEARWLVDKAEYIAMTRKMRKVEFSRAFTAAIDTVISEAREKASSEGLRKLEAFKAIIKDWKKNRPEERYIVPKPLDEGGSPIKDTYETPPVRQSEAEKKAVFTEEPEGIPWKGGFVLSRDPRLGEVVTASLSITPSEDVCDVKVAFHPLRGVELVRGDTLANADFIAKGDTKEFSIDVRFISSPVTVGYGFDGVGTPVMTTIGGRCGLTRFIIDDTNQFVPYEEFSRRRAELKTDPFAGERIEIMNPVVEGPWLWNGGVALSREAVLWDTVEVSFTVTAFADLHNVRVIFGELRGVEIIGDSTLHVNTIRKGETKKFSVRARFFSAPATIAVSMPSEVLLSLEPFRGGAVLRRVLVDEETGQFGIQEDLFQDPWWNFDPLLGRKCRVSQGDAERNKRWIEQMRAIEPAITDWDALYLYRDAMLYFPQSSEESLRVYRRQGWETVREQGKILLEKGWLREFRKENRTYPTDIPENLKKHLEWLKQIKRESQRED